MQKSAYVILGTLLSIFVFAASGSAVERKEFTARTDPDGVQRVDMVGGSYYFDPNYVIVKVNVPVELRIKKSGMTPHDFVLQAPEAGMNVKEELHGDSTVVRFVPAKTGKYPFYCSKKMPLAASHKDQGMEGVLDVRD